MSEDEGGTAEGLAATPVDCALALGNKNTCNKDARIAIPVTPNPSIIVSLVQKRFLLSAEEIRGDWIGCCGAGG